MSDDVRAKAEVVETEDGEYEVLPPTVRTSDDPPEDVVEAVREAVEAEPNTVTDPLVRGADDDRLEAALVASFNELPAGDGQGWLPPYRAREDLREALQEELPDDVELEERNGHTIDLYRTGSDR